MTPQEELELIEIEQEQRRRKLRAAGSGGGGEGEDRPSASQPERKADKASSLEEMFAAMGLEGGGAALGQLAGAYTGPLARVGVPVLGGLGGMAGNAINQIRRGGKFHVGEMLAVGAASSIPGEPLTGAGIKPILREGAKYAAGEAAGAVIQAGADEGRLPSVGEVAQRAAVGLVGAVAGRPFAKEIGPSSREVLLGKRTAILEKLKPEGFTAPESEVTKTTKTFTENLAGHSVEHEATLRNAVGTQKLGREHIGLSKSPDPISQEEIASRLMEEGAPYRKIEKMAADAQQGLEDIAVAIQADPRLAQNPQVAAAVQELAAISKADIKGVIDLRDRARKLFRAAEGSGGRIDTAAKREAKELMEKADAQEEIIGKAGELIGEAGLLDELRKARVEIAKIHSIQDSLKAGIVDPQALLAQRELQGRPLSNRANDIADFAEAFPRLSQNVNPLAAPSTASPRGFVAGAVNKTTGGLASRGARIYLLSDFKLRSVLNPYERQNFSASLARLAAQAGVRIEEPEEETVQP